jgi:hypothetical protein
MKRIAWILLAVLGTVFVQVQPLAPLRSTACRCMHCAAHGACGMPGCAQAACPSTQVSATACEPSRPAGVEARKDLPAGPARTELLPAPARPGIIPILPVAAMLAEDGPRVPLFRAHCSLLI